MSEDGASSVFGEVVQWCADPETGVFHKPTAEVRTRPPFGCNTCPEMKNGKLKRLGRIDMRRDRLAAFAATLSANDIVIVEAAGNAAAVADVIAPHEKRVAIADRSLAVKRRGRVLSFGMDGAGRWSLICRELAEKLGDQDRAAVVEHVARTLLRLAIDIGPNGIRVSPRYRDHEKRYFGPTPKGNHRPAKCRTKNRRDR